MLIDTIASCTAAIEHKAEVKQNRQADEAFLFAIGKLNQVNSALKETLLCMAELHRRNISPKPILKSGTREELLRCTNACGRALYKGELDSAAVDAFAAHLKTAQAELAAAWKRDAPAYAGGPNGYLTMISGLTDDPRAARALSAAIRTTAGSPVSQKGILALSEQVEKANRMISSFSLKPDVESFLKKVAAGRATVLDLTPDILEWLREQRLLGKLRLDFPS